MKKTLIALTAGMMLAGVASAQGYAPPPPGGWHQGPGRGGWDRDAFWRGAPDNPYERIRFLQDRVNRGMSDGSLNRGEARRVNRELDGVRRWIRDMHWSDAGRLTPDQRAQVQARLDRISGQIRWLRHNGW